MAQSEQYDDLDEMLVPQEPKQEPESVTVSQEQYDDFDDDVSLGRAFQTNTAAQMPRRSKKASAKQQAVLAVVIVAALVVLIGGLLIAFCLGAFTDSPDVVSGKVAPEEGRTAFLNESNIPELSAEGVKGLLKEAYYTVDGDLAVTLNLSNGTPYEQKVVKISARIFNAANETVAQQTVDTFLMGGTVAANDYGEVYFLIDKEYVALTNDSLGELGTTLEISSNPTGGVVPDGGNAAGGDSASDEVGDGPKDIAADRTYYENTGNIPELSAEGVKASIIRARYTNDGSLAITLSMSNGTDTPQTVSRLDFLLQNGDTAATITDYTFDTFEAPVTIGAKSYTEVDLIVDAAYVAIQDDALSTLSCTISVAAGPTE